MVVEKPLDATLRATNQCARRMSSSPPVSDRTHARLLRGLAHLGGHALTLLLLATPAALLYGHAGGAPHGLSLTQSYITEYAFSAPHWPWIIVSIFLFAVLLAALAIGFMLRIRQNVAGILGCALLAASAMAMFFVAYTPMRRAASPEVELRVPWVPQWWVTSHAATTPYEEGMADAYSDVHYRAIRLVTINGLLGILFLGIGLLARGKWKCFAWFTIVSAFVMAGLFIVGDQVERAHGLWQRLGFALMYVWLWSARLHLTAPTQEKAG
jgi:hypothetical protein